MRVSREAPLARRRRFVLGEHCPHQRMRDQVLAPVLVEHERALPLTFVLRQQSVVRGEQLGVVDLLGLRDPNIELICQAETLQELCPDAGQPNTKPSAARAQLSPNFLRQIWGLLEPRRDAEGWAAVRRRA